MFFKRWAFRIFLTFLLVHCQLSIAQQGAVVLENLVLKEEGDSLLFSMDLAVISEAVYSGQSLRISPRLTTEDTSFIFPSVLLNGKKKDQQYKRRLKLRGLPLPADSLYLRTRIQKGVGEQIRYEIRIPYEMWMDTARLEMHQILSACRDQEQWFILPDVAGVQTAGFTPYPPLVRVNYIEPQQEVKHHQMQGVAFLDFRPGSAEILPSYRRNTQELSKIEASIRSVRENPDVTLTGLHIHGYSSPEGSYSLNEQLSAGRAGALSRYLSQSFGLSSSMLHVSSTPEDWDGLREKMEESELPERERILAIIENASSPDQKEQQLKALGSTYQLLLNQFFPSLRRVSYRIEYTVRDYTPLEAEELLEKNPAYLSPAELFHLALSYGEESPKWGEILHLSALLYPDNPITQLNLAAWLLQKGDTEAAGPLLEKVKQEEIAANDTGVYYLLVREPDKAEAYFRKALAAGILSAEYNLEEVEKVREDIRRQKRRNSE